MSKKVKTEFFPKLYEDSRIFNEKDLPFFRNSENVIFTLKQLALQELGEVSTKFSEIRETYEQEQRNILSSNELIDTNIDFMRWTIENNKKYRIKCNGLIVTVKEKVVDVICEENELSWISKVFLSAIMSRSRIQLDVQTISYRNIKFVTENFYKIISKILPSIIDYYDAQNKKLNEPESVYRNRISKTFEKMVNEVSKLMPENSCEFWDILLPNEIRQYVSEKREDFSKYLSYAPNNSKKIIELYFGLNGCKPMTFSEIASIVGMSADKVKKRFDLGIKTLRGRVIRRNF